MPFDSNSSAGTSYIAQGMMRRAACGFWGAALWMVVAAGCSTTADYHNIDGVRLYQQRNHQLALQKFQQAVAADPRNADAYYNLASTLHQMGTQTTNRDVLTQAETIYNQCLDLNENHVECRRGLAVLLAQTDRADSAFRLLSNWVAQRPDLADARIELARLYEEFEDLETAKLHLNQAVLVDQRNSRAWAALGKIREQAGETEQALANYQRSMALNPQQPAIGARIAALNRSVTPGVLMANPNTPGTRGVSPGTRTVTVPQPQPRRY